MQWTNSPLWLVWTLWYQHSQASPITPKEKDDDGTSTVTVRPEVSFIVHYVPHVDGGEEKFWDMLNRIWLKINPNETGDLGIFKDLGSGAKGTPNKLWCRGAASQLKPTTPPMPVSCLADSLARGKTMEPSCELCPTTVEILCCNVRLAPLPQHLTKEMQVQVSLSL